LTKKADFFSLQASVKLNLKSRCAWLRRTRT